MFSGVPSPAVCAVWAFPAVVIGLRADEVIE
jgi:hypothetical protein